MNINNHLSNIAQASTRIVSGRLDDTSGRWAYGQPAASAVRSYLDVLSGLQRQIGSIQGDMQGMVMVAGSRLVPILRPIFISSSNESTQRFKRDVESTNATDSPIAGQLQPIAMPQQLEHTALPIDSNVTVDQPVQELVVSGEKLAPVGLVEPPPDSAQSVRSLLMKLKAKVKQPKHKGKRKKVKRKGTGKGQPKPTEKPTAPDGTIDFITVTGGTSEVDDGDEGGNGGDNGYDEFDYEDDWNTLGFGSKPPAPPGGQGGGGTGGNGMPTKSPGKGGDNDGNGLPTKPPGQGGDNNVFEVVAGEDFGVSIPSLPGQPSAERDNDNPIELLVRPVQNQINNLIGMLTRFSNNGITG